MSNKIKNGVRSHFDLTCDFGSIHSKIMLHFKLKSMVISLSPYRSSTCKCNFTSSGTNMLSCSGRGSTASAKNKNQSRNSRKLAKKSADENNKQPCINLLSNSAFCSLDSTDANDLETRTENNKILTAYEQPWCSLFTTVHFQMNKQIVFVVSSHRLSICTSNKRNFVTKDNCEYIKDWKMKTMSSIYLELDCWQTAIIK